MSGFYERCFICAFDNEKICPGRCFECAEPEILKQEWIYSLGLYFPRFREGYRESRWSRAVAMTKRNCLPVIASFGRILAWFISRYLSDLKPCLIVNVPGFMDNSGGGLFQKADICTTNLLLESVADNLRDDKWIIEGNLLVQTRKKPVKQHCCKTDAKRMKNIRDIFAVSEPGRTKDKNIILLDDVVTSGATMKECTEVLYESGAASVVGMTLARTFRKRESFSINR